MSKLDNSLDLSIPIMIHLMHGDEQTFCWAQLGWNGPTLVAEPHTPDQELCPWRWRSLTIHGENVTGPISNGLGKPVYQYDRPVPMD